MTIQEFNHTSFEKRKEALFKCCSCNSYVEKLSAINSFSSVQELKEASDRIWFSLNERDWLEAFTHHPKIGDVTSLKKKFASTAHWASGEQSSVKDADGETLIELKDLNDAYEKKFGYIFIVCATGKSASEMLSLLKLRIDNAAEEELIIAAAEQNKITHIRIDKLFA